MNNRVFFRKALSRLLCIPAFVALLCGSHLLQAAPERHEGNIRAFEAADRLSHPPKGGIVFTGSSTITRWNNTLADDFPGYPVIGRGFGGSTVEDAVYYVRRTVLPYEPRLVVFYAGENDIANGHSAQRVADDFARFCEIIHETLPDTQILYLVMKPSPTRWHLQPQFDEVRRLISDYAARTFNVACFDMTPAMLNVEGRPRFELYEPDMLHLNKDAYVIWREAILPLLEQGVKTVPVQPPSGAPLPSMVPQEAIPASGIFVDFGSPNLTTSNMPGLAWNNVTTANQRSPQGLALVDVKGAKTGIVLKVTSAFSDANIAGTKSVDASLARFPLTATADSLFGHASAWRGRTPPLPELLLSGLDPLKRYQFTFFASRAQSKEDRTARYVLQGAQTDAVELDAANNTSAVAVTGFLAPNADGTIRISIEPAQTNTDSSRFVYLGALEIQTAP